MPNSRILPPLRRTARDAKVLAAVVHATQRDKAGEPYVLHLGRVALRLTVIAGGCWDWTPEQQDEAQQIAWLHDTIEDTNLTGDDLRAEGFSESVVTGVLHLTKPAGGVPYAAWIDQLAALGTLPAILVKLADLGDNADPLRIARLPAVTQDRLRAKYKPATARLVAAAQARGWQP